MGRPSPIAACQNPTPGRWSDIFSRYYSRTVLSARLSWRHGSAGRPQSRAVICSWRVRACQTRFLRREQPAPTPLSPGVAELLHCHGGTPPTGKRSPGRRTRSTRRGSPPPGPLAPPLETGPIGLEPVAQVRDRRRSPHDEGGPDCRIGCPDLVALPRRKPPSLSTHTWHGARGTYR